MPTHRLHIPHPRPYFAELPYYLWGQVNYDSDGDCKRPTDRDWTVIQLENRDTRETLTLRRESGADASPFLIDADDTETAARLARFLADRCGATFDPATPLPAPDWDHRAALARAARVAAEFEHPLLAPFDTHLFWGSWKWIGWYASEFTWVGRWIMHALTRDDPRAVHLCIDWLKAPPFSPDQSLALAHALSYLTKEAPKTPAQWIRWYDGGPLSQGAHTRFPKPDLPTWLADIAREFPEFPPPEPPPT